MPLEIKNTNDAGDFGNHFASPCIILHCRAQHPNVRVHVVVAENKNRLPITAMQLAKDSNPELRYALAENQQIDWGVLNILAGDKNPLVADRAQKTLSHLKQVSTSADFANKTY